MKTNKPYILYQGYATNMYASVIVKYLFGTDEPRIGYRLANFYFSIWYELELKAKGEM